MTGRDRIVMMAIAVLAVLGAGWLLVVSPERKQAASLQHEVDTATSQLASAEGQLANARAAQARYSSAYASIVNLGKAVPPSREVPSLVYELALASNEKHVDLSSIVAGSGGSSAAGSASAAQTPSASLAGFTQMPFTFVFNGSFLDLYNLFQQLNHFTARTASGGLQVTGRLLTLQSAKLAPVTKGNEAGTQKARSGLLSGTITATAYVLPASQGLTGGATPGSPGSSASSPASSSLGQSSPTAPAIARVTP
jgi:type II secretion system (T2SS) protein M